jgi:hypothetical protein
MAHDVASDQVDLEAAFSDREWQDFRQADIKAGTAIVALMLGIFVTGIFLYSIVVITL